MLSLAALIYALATLTYLLALFLLEIKPAVSKVGFICAALGFLLSGSLIFSIDTTDLRLLLVLSIIWHVWNSYAGWRQYYNSGQLQHRLLQSWSMLALINLALYILVLFDYQNFEHWFDELALVVALVLGARTWLRIKRATLKRTNIPLKDLPTVSLLVPARNEDHALTRTLHSLLAIDYPKLEILVLDDCSHDRTPEILREFAHDGIRFIQTEELPDDWVGKNYALASLVREATGEILLFADVDVALQPNSVHQLVKHLIESDLDMLSVIPQRPVNDFVANLLSPVMPWWQLIFPMGLLHLSAASTSCYMIRREAYSRIGGYEALRTSIIPEHRLANMLGKKYQYILADKRLGISTRKRLSSQEDTQIRLLFPMAGASAGNVLFAIFLISLAFFVPVIYAIKDHSLSAILACLLIVISLLAYARRTLPASWKPAIFWMPLIFIHEASLLVYSMFKYELGVVNWKDRNVCYPRLQIISHLPPVA